VKRRCYYRKKGGLARVEKKSEFETKKKKITILREKGWYKGKKRAHTRRSTGKESFEKEKKK